MGSKLFVGSLPWSVNDQELFEIFSPFGQVREAKVITDRETGQSRGFGFVTYNRDEDAAKAIREMNRAVVGQRTINVNEAQERSPGGGGGGFRNNAPPPPRNGGGGGEHGRDNNSRRRRRDYDE